jgi:hypothetical protein
MSFFLNRLGEISGSHDGEYEDGLTDISEVLTASIIMAIRLSC